MAEKLLHIPLKIGSLIDIINQVVGVNIGCNFVIGDKGHTLDFSLTDEINNYGIIPNVVAIAFVIKPTTNTKLFLDNGVDRLEIVGGNYSGVGLTECTVFETTAVDTDVAIIDRWQCVIAEFAGGINFATDFEVDITALTQLAGDIILFDAVPSVGEKNALYDIFTTLKTYSPPIRNFKRILPNDLSSIPNILGAWNSQNDYIDISGRGFDGTPQGNMLLGKDGYHFDYDDDYFSTGNITELNNASSFTISGWAIQDTLDVGSCLIQKYFSATVRLQIIIVGTNMYFLLGNTAAQYGFFDYSTKVTAEKMFHYAMVFDGSGATNSDRLKGYINCEEVTLTYGGTIPATTLNYGATNVDIGRSTLSALFWNGLQEDIRIFSNPYSFPQLCELYNDWASQVVLKESFERIGVDGVTKNIQGWNAGTGTWRVNEVAVATGVLKQGDKYLQCVGAGTIGIQNNTAYGTFEFDIYKGGGGNISYYKFISDAILVGTGGNGYHLLVAGAESIRIREGANTLTQSLNSYIAINTWYCIRVERTTYGVFTTYIKGGAFLVWTLVDSSGGGSNPSAANQTHTTSNYFSIDLDAGDRIANIVIKQGVEV